jgi:hypothetical protein
LSGQRGFYGQKHRGKGEPWNGYKFWGIQMAEKILEKMKKGVYYPGNHLGKKGELSDLLEKGYLQRMDGSFLCGPDSEPNYCLTDKGLSYKGQRLK